jgi:acetolactate synthase-1/2/3 large subunit
MADMLSGGDMLIRALQEEGVDCIFGYPGGAVLHIYDAIFKQQKIEHVLVRHEQAATHMADGYARATGKAGVVLVTSGPGATNAITGIATAHMDSIPMVVLSGQVPSGLIGSDAFQETDMVGVSRPVVKHSFIVRKCEEIPSIVRKAFHIATTGRPGPVVIDIPKDTTDPQILGEYEFPETVEMRSYNPVVKGNSKQIKKAVEHIFKAKKPILYVGGGAIQGEVSDELERMVDLLNAPLTNTLMGLGAYPGSNNKCLGMLGMHGTYQANMAMHNSDLILAIGARFDDRVTNNPEKFSPKAKIIQIDIDPASIAKIIGVDIPIVGDVKHVLSSMNEAIQSVWTGFEEEEKTAYQRNTDTWWEQIEGWRSVHGLDHSLALAAEETIQPQTVIKSLYRATNGEAFVTSDVGQHQMFAAQYYHFDKPRRWINSGGLGTMGFGLPSAMGVQFAYPNAVVACVTGEGSFMMNMQELSTCLQYSLPIKIINLNNQALGMVKQWQDMQYSGRHSSSTYSDSLPDFKTLVEAFGHKGIKVEKSEELQSALDLAFSEEMRDHLVFVDVWIDPETHVYPMSVRGGSLADMILSRDQEVAV